MLGVNLLASVLLHPHLFEAEDHPVLFIVALAGLVASLTGAGGLANVIPVSFWPEVESPAPAATSEPNYTSWLVQAVGIGLVVVALVYNQWLIAALFPAHAPLVLDTVHRVWRAQGLLGLTGIDFVWLAWLIRAVPSVDAFFQRDIAVNILLAGLTFWAPILVIETILRPSPDFYRQAVERTPIFMRDPELGWRLRPNSEGKWASAMISINGKGLRGPELPYTKPPGVTRVVYLGDSQVFGWAISDYRKTFPYLTDALLEDELGTTIETINAGVDGYSPWQYYIWLKKEGIKYNPDLIVVSFVLNDVTEKFGLTRFGGNTEGWQIAHVSSTWDWLLTHSAIIYYSNRLVQRLRFGPDLQAGARDTELMEVESLIETPDDPQIQQAWSVTLGNLDEIFDYAQDKDIPVVLIVFPYRFQLEDSNSDPIAVGLPQAIVVDHTTAQGIPTLDVLPLFLDIIDQEGSSPTDYFIDSVHLTEKGARFTAQVLAGFMLDSEVIGD
jgi:lysophospholipase L1-like esterase